MEKYTKNRGQKNAETRINTRFSAPMGGGGVLGYKLCYAAKKYAQNLAKKNIFLLAQHSQQNCKKPREKINFSCVDNLFNIFLHIKSKKMRKINSAQYKNFFPSFCFFYDRRL